MSLSTLRVQYYFVIITIMAVLNQPIIEGKLCKRKYAHCFLIPSWGLISSLPHDQLTEVILTMLSR